MADIISFPSTNKVDKNKLDTLQKIKLYKPKTSLECLHMYKNFLTKEDYEEILCCILDKEYYDNADYQTKDMVDNYFQYKY